MDKKTTPKIVRLTPPPKITKENILGFGFGVRPYRVGGFRLDREDICGKSFYHNYGHGGGGVSLAPGCARRIVDKFLMEHKDKEREVAILGCGYMGLFQSIILAELGFDVTIYAHIFPQKEGFYKDKSLLVSQVAGGFWMPFGCDFTSNRPLHDATTKESYQFYTDCIEKKLYKGLSYKDAVLIDYENPILTAVPEGLMNWREVKVDFGNGVLHDAIIYRTILIDGDTFLNELMDEARQKGVKFVEREFVNLSDILTLKEKVIFNCMGGESRKFFKDDNLIPIAGHLIYVKKHPGVDYFLCSRTPDPAFQVTTYPQSNKLAIGLAYQKIGWITEPNKQTLETIMNNMNKWIDERAGPKPKL
jgi:hypothetical protein